MPAFSKSPKNKYEILGYFGENIAGCCGLILEHLVNRCGTVAGKNRVDLRGVAG